MIPNVAVLEIENPHFHMPRLWIPLILLWIPLALLLLLLSPIALHHRLRHEHRHRRRPISRRPHFLGHSVQLRGTDVRVTANGNKVLVRIL